VNSLSGTFRSGAEWWASVRSTSSVLPCSQTPGFDPVAVSGCEAARNRLNGPDIRRHAEPEYRAGWNSLSIAAAETGAYSQGVADRQKWEAWFNALSGSYHEGAEWWASVRSLPRPPACTQTPGPDRTAVIGGCNAARARLTDADRRRRNEPDYRAGWNSL
jgi:hypothetical protein